jgi:anoctamin-10
LKTGGVVSEVFPLHDEKRRNRLLEKWSYNWQGLWSQPIDEIYSYFGPKVAIYFAFLGMYSKWLVFPGVLGLILWFISFGPWEPVKPPLFSMTVIVWSVLFLQFWKRHNAELQARWGMIVEDPDILAMRAKMASEDGSPNLFEDLTENESRSLESEEWQGRLKSLKDNGLVFAGIVCVQLPFELLYAHLNKIAYYDVLRYALTAGYIIVIQNATKFGGQVALNMVKAETYKSTDAESDGLIYKVFGIYFMQSYIGLFYQAFFHRDFFVLRQLLIQRLIVSQLMNNFTENLMPYLTYRYAKYKAFKEDQDLKKAAGEKVVDQHASRIEKEKLKPTYCSSIPSDLEDGLFDGKQPCETL